MTTTIKTRVHGQIKIKGEQANFHGDEILYVSVRDTLRHDAECIELGSVKIHLQKGQKMPINYQCSYDPNIERNEQLLYTNDTDLPLAEEVDIELVKIE
jgi:hypothetical protein